MVVIVRPMTFDVLVHQEVEREGTDEAKRFRSILGGDLPHVVDAQDWSEDIGDDVMEKEALVGDEQCHKGHQVRVDTGIEQNLQKMNKNMSNILTDACQYHV